VTFEKYEVEYTDAPTLRRSRPAAINAVPYCGHLCRKTRNARPLRLGARRDTNPEGKASDLVAVMFSIVPGLGHIYKGHIFAAFSGCLRDPGRHFCFPCCVRLCRMGLGLFFFISRRRCCMPTGIDDRVVAAERRTKARSISPFNRYIVTSLHR